MVFLVLLSMKTGHFLGTDSLSGHWKEAGKKKQWHWFLVMLIVILAYMK